MVERFLLDRVDTEATRAPVRRQHDPVTLTRAHEAEASLAFAQLARPGTHVTLDAAVFQAMPMPRRDDAHRQRSG